MSKIGKKYNLFSDGCLKAESLFLALKELEKNSIFIDEVIETFDNRTNEYNTSLILKSNNTNDQSLSDFAKLSDSSFFDKYKNYNTSINFAVDMHYESLVELKSAGSIGDSDNIFKFEAPLQYNFLIKNYENYIKNEDIKIDETGLPYFYEVLSGFVTNDNYRGFSGTEFFENASQIITDNRTELKTNIIPPQIDVESQKLTIDKYINKFFIYKNQFPFYADIKFDTHELDEKSIIGILNEKNLSPDLMNQLINQGEESTLYFNLTKHIQPTTTKLLNTQRQINNQRITEIAARNAEIKETPVSDLLARAGLGGGILSSFNTTNAQAKTIRPANQNPINRNSSAINSKVQDKIEQLSNAEITQRLNLPSTSLASNVLSQINNSQEATNSNNLSKIQRLVERVGEGEIKNQTNIATNIAENILAKIAATTNVENTNTLSISEIDVSSFLMNQIRSALTNMDFTFIASINQAIQNKSRSLMEVLMGKNEYIEVIGYRLKKCQANEATGVSYVDPIQEWYIPNTFEGQINWVDSQIKYNKLYAYKLDPIVLTFATDFKIKNLEKLDTNRLKINFKSKLKIKAYTLNGLVDDPKKTLGPTYVNKLLDFPPLEPEVEIVPFIGVDNQIKFNFNTSIGKKTVPYFVFNTAEINKIKELQKAQNKDTNSNLLTFSSDEPSTAIEVYRIETKPKSYEDFFNQKLDTFSTNGTSGASFVDNIQPNKKYYYTARAIDYHNNLSNPTPVYEVEIINENGLIIPNINLVQLDKNDNNKQMSKSFKRYLKIQPAIRHRLANEERVTENNIELGSDEVKPWDKKFKLRLISKSTGKKMDINFVFKYNKPQ